MTHATDRLADAVVEKLQIIATASVPSGINKTGWATTEQPTVMRLVQNARTIPDFPSIVVTARSHRYNRNAQRTTQGLYEIETTFQIECYVEVMDDIDGELAKMLHDVHAALGDDFTLGGTCRDSFITAADALLSAHGDPLAGLVIDFVARYRTSDANPGTLI